jgi:hypothetical protein
MNKLIAAALALTMVGAIAAQAAPHHRHHACAVRHHHRVCHAR